MPTVLRERGYRFFFYSNKARGPAHVDVKKGRGHAKVWLESGVMAWSKGLGPSHVRTIRAIVKMNLTSLREAWNEHFDH